MPAGAVHRISMVSPYTFSPARLTIPLGDIVKVTNADATAHHTFTDSGVFDSGDLGQNGSYSYRFTKAGIFNFVCSYHAGAGMKGAITVTR